MRRRAGTRALGLAVVWIALGGAGGLLGALPAHAPRRVLIISSFGSRFGSIAVSPTPAKS